jgi:hypothetical protein
MSLPKDPESTEIFNKKPYLREYFAKPVASEVDYQVLESRSLGNYYVSYKGKPLSSPMDPKKQASRQGESIRIQSNHLVLLLGLGNPEILNWCNEHLRSNNVVIAVDADQGITRTLWELFLKHFLMIPGRHLFAGSESLIHLWRYLDSLPIQRLKGVRVISNPSSIQKDSEFYREVETHFIKIFSAKMSDLMTKMEFERIWLKNSITNSLRFNDSPPRYPIKILENKFKGIPAVLASAGPSFSKVFPLIQKFRDKYFLFSCDTTGKVIRKLGDSPDAVVTLDAQQNSQFHFLGENYSQIPIFADLVASPNLIQRLPFNSIVHSITTSFKSNADGSSFEERTIGSELIQDWFGDVGGIQSGGSVATSAFDMLRFMGFDPIILIGQDLAYTGLQIHSSGTHHSDNWIPKLERKKSLEQINYSIVQKRDLVKVENVNGDEIVSDFVLNLYRSWFEDSIFNLGAKVYNLSQGAKIENSVQVDLSQMEPFWGKFKPHGSPWLKETPWIHSNEPYFDPTSILGLKNELKKQFQNFLEQLEFANEDLTRIDSIWDQLHHIPFLQNLVHKTELYLMRNDKGIEETKKKELLRESINKELRFIYRSIFQMIEN